VAKSKLKKDSVSFGPRTLIRLIIFIIIVYFAIVYLSSSTTPVPNILGEHIKLQEPDLKSTTDKLYQFLPEKSQKTLENLPAHPAIISLNQKFTQIKDQVSGFPQKQINQLKKQIIDQIYQDITKDLN